MSIFEDGDYKTEIIDEYESERVNCNGDLCYKVKRRDVVGYSALIFYGLMPKEMENILELCSSKDSWQAVKEKWLPKEDHSVPEGANRLSDTGWYEVTAGNIRRIVHDLDGIITLNFAIIADSADASELHFLEDLARTTKVEKIADGF